jgi:glycosyltransferase involved in cell wall biosynthesis
MSARPIRVLHLRDSAWVDGPGRTILDTATHIDGTRVEYHVGAFVSAGTSDHALVKSLRAAGKSVWQLTDRGGLDRELVAQIVRLVDQLHIDVLHSSEFRSNLMALLVRRQRPVKLVATVHGWIVNNLRGRIYRLADKFLLRWFDGVIFVSAATRRLIPAWWLPPRRTCVLHNGLVLGTYGKDLLTASRRSVDPQAEVVVLNVGRLSLEKGQALLLRAVAELSGRYPRLQVKFAGTGPEEAPLRALAQALGIADRVHFLGYVQDMPALYAQADLLVQSSLTEGLPNVILEVAYLRLPCVATRVGGTAEVMQHGASGWLIEPGSVGEIKAGIEKFLASPEEFSSMTAAGHEAIKQNFSFAVRTQRLMEFYERLLASGAA